VKISVVAVTTYQASIPKWGTLFGRSVISHLSNLVSLFPCYRTTTILQCVDRYCEYWMFPQYLSKPNLSTKQVQTVPPDGESFLCACEKCRKEGV